MFKWVGNQNERPVVNPDDHALFFAKQVFTDFQIIFLMFVVIFFIGVWSICQRFTGTANLAKDGPSILVQMGEISGVDSVDGHGITTVGFRKTPLGVRPVPTHAVGVLLPRG